MTAIKSPQNATHPNPRPVAQTLRELTYLLHATRPILTISWSQPNVKTDVPRVVNRCAKL
jgi:hypothetical protein